MTEADLLREVHKMARDRHLLLFHDGDSRGSLGRGFPDLVVSGVRGTIFIELKTDGSTLTPDQRHWGSVLEKGGERWMIRRPRDLKSGIIAAELDSIAAYRQLAI